MQWHALLTRFAITYAHGSELAFKRGKVCHYMLLVKISCQMRPGTGARVFWGSWRHVVQRTLKVLFETELPIREDARCWDSHWPKKINLSSLEDCQPPTNPCWVMWYHLKVAFTSKVFGHFYPFNYWLILMLLFINVYKILNKMSQNTSTWCSHLSVHPNIKSLNPSKCHNSSFP